MIRIQFPDHITEKEQLFQIQARYSRIVEEISLINHRMVHISDDPLHNGAVIGSGNPQVLQMNHCISVDGMNRIQELLHRAVTRHMSHCVIMKHFEPEVCGIPNLRNAHRKNHQRSKRGSRSAEKCH